MRRTVTRSAKAPIGFLVVRAPLERPSVPPLAFRPLAPAHPFFRAFTARELELAAGFGVVAP